MTIVRPRVRCGHARTIDLGVEVGCKGSGSHTFAIWCRGVNIGVRAIIPVLEIYVTTRACPVGSILTLGLAELNRGSVVGRIRIWKLVIFFLDAGHDAVCNSTLPGRP